MSGEGVGEFWAAAVAAPLVVLTDFDDTVTQIDVGDTIVRQLAPPSPETLRRFAAREVGSRLFWQETMARVVREEAEAVADTAPMDPDFPAFVRWCRQQAIPVGVVSDGFWFYIRRVLEREGLADLPVFCNQMPGAGSLTFPHGNPACEFCGCCKAQVAKRVRESGARVIYIGDGISDLYAAAFADWVFAKGRLARHLSEAGSPFYPLATYADVLRTLDHHLNAFRSGTAPRRAALRPDPICRI